MRNKGDLNANTINFVDSSVVIASTSLKARVDR